MRLSSGGRDVFFVADVEPGTGLYKFDMDVGASAKDFSSQSGETLGQLSSHAFYRLMPNDFDEFNESFISKSRFFIFPMKWDCVLYFVYFYFLCYEIAFYILYFSFLPP